MKFPFSILLTSLLVLFGCASSLPPANEKPVVTIVGAKLIDGTGADAIEDSVIVIEDTRIRLVGPRSQTPVPKGGEMVDGRGKVVIPGLIDLHVHYSGDRAQMEKQLQAQLHWGVTTVRSMGIDSGEHLAAIADLRAGHLAGPRIYTAGRGFTHPKGHPAGLDLPLRPATPEEAREQVKELAAKKVDFIKMWVDSLRGAVPKITPEVRQAIIDEAARNHIPVVAHIADEADVYELGNLGVTDFLHTVSDHEPMAEKFIAFCKGHSVSFTPTLTVLQHDWYFAENPQALEDPGIRMGVNAAALADMEKPETREKMLANPRLSQAKEDLARAQRFVKQMAGAGVTIGVGSDSGAGAIAAGWGTHNELVLLSEAGLPPLEVLHIAAQRSAALVSGGKAEFGTLLTGKIADLILLDADPLEDIQDTRKIARVMQAGKWVRGGETAAAGR